MCEILDSSCLFWAARSFWSPVVAVFSLIVPSCLVTLADWSSSFRGQPISLGVSLHLWQGRWKWGTVMSQPYSTLFGDNLGCSRNHGLSYRFFFFYSNLTSRYKYWYKSLCLNYTYQYLYQCRCNIKLSSIAVLFSQNEVCCHCGHSGMGPPLVLFCLLLPES